MPNQDIKNKVEKITCPECENKFDIDISELEIGDIKECSVCGSNIEIVSLNPIQCETVTMDK